MQRRIATIIVLFCLAQTLGAQVAVSAALDSTHMLIGDQLKLHLTVSYAPEVKLLEVDLSKIEAVPEIEVIRQSKWDTLRRAPEYVLEQDLIFTVFDSGAYFIPAIPFVFEQNGQQSVRMTNELLIEVGVPPADSIALAPIKPIIEEPFKLEDLKWLGIALGVLALLLGLGYLFYRRQQNTAIPPPPEIVIPPHEIALRKLTELKQAKLWQKGEIKAYQSQLTFIVREYLEGRYDIQALESTTYQILKDLTPIQLSDDWKKRLKEMLELADLVKFAKAEPPIEKHERLMKDAEDFVLTTQQKILESDPVQEASESTES
ncbi:MAG: hypothetical protein AAGD05_02810 [Bacteroidota bacterium]